MTRFINALSLATICFCVCIPTRSQVAGPQDLKGFCRALGDSLTIGGSVPAKGYVADFPSFLQKLGTCTVVSNEGVAGQTSTQIAVRAGALPTTATIAGGIIPASGPVTITFKPGYEPMTRFSFVDIPVVIAGVSGVLSHKGAPVLFIRSVPGAPVPVPPDAPLTIVTGKLNDGFVIIWAGKNNAYHPDQVVSDIAAIVAALPAPKRFVVLSVTNSDAPFQWQGTPQYKTYITLDKTLAAAYPNNFLDIRSLLIAAYNPDLPQDVIDHGHDVLPSSLRLYTDSVLATAITDTTSCSNMPPSGFGSTIEIGTEKIYISNMNAGKPTEDGCTRGYAGTIPATHLPGAPVTSLDATHLNAAGQRFVAEQINTWILAHDAVLGKRRNAFK